MAVADAKVPEILYLGEILDDEEIVLVSLRIPVCSLTWPGQVSELGHMIVDFAGSLRRGQLWRLVVVLGYRAS